MDAPHLNGEQFDLALSHRLAQLGSRPVDTSHLKRRLDEDVTVGNSAPLRRWLSKQSWRSLTSDAAIVLLLVATSLLVINSSSRAVASPTDLANLYHQVVSQTPPSMAVSSIDAANFRITNQWAKAPALPTHVPGEVASCCLRHLHGVPVASVHLNYQNHAISLLVAYTRMIASPMGQIIYRDGRQFVVTSHDRLRMVMTHHDTRWLCVVGDLPQSRLVDVVAAIRF